MSDKSWQLKLPIPFYGTINCILDNKKTYNLVSYRMLFDFFALEMTDGVSESGYIRAFNRRRGMLCESSLKECPKTIFIKAVEDFEHALEVILALDA